VTVYDLSYTRFPELYGAAYQRGSAAMLQSLHGDDRIVTASYFIRDELCERGIASAERIDVVPLAADPDTFYHCDDPETIAKVRVRYGIPDGPYVLSVNSCDPRKNVAHAIHAFAVAVHERGGPLSLVLTGNAGPASDRIREAIAQYPELRGCIVLPGHVPDHDLAPLYSAAGAFVYPSIYEGFGLPPLEAMQCGTPAITLRTSALPEVVGDGGVMVPPGDRDALAAAMLAAVNDESGRRVRRHRALAQAGRFSWDRSTRTMLAAYRASLEGATAYTAIARSSHSASRLSR
jgi:glycosyltransferase involved in cell wall biosynthesis